MYWYFLPVIQLLKIQAKLSVTVNHHSQIEINDSKHEPGPLQGPRRRWDGKHKHCASPARLLSKDDKRWKFSSIWKKITYIYKLIFTNFLGSLTIVHGISLPFLHAVKVVAA